MTGVNNRWYLVGIIADTGSCGDTPSVFTKMTAFYDWLAPIFEGEDPASKYNYESYLTMTMIVHGVTPDD